jgi:hypothetical protein
LVLSVLNGLTVSEYVEGDSAKSPEAFQIFVSLLLAGLQNLDAPQPPSAPPPHVMPPQHLPQGMGAPAMGGPVMGGPVMGGPGMPTQHG